MSDVAIVASQPTSYHLVSFQDLLVRLGASHAARRSRRLLATRGSPSCRHWGVPFDGRVEDNRPVSERIDALR